MANFKTSGIHLAGISACVPETKRLIHEVETSSEKIKFEVENRIGIKSIHSSMGKLTTSDLCFAAAVKLLGEVCWRREEIGLLILVTQTPDYALPSSSIVLQMRLGLSKDVIAFDINLGCSGWVYGLATAASLMRTFGIKKGLLLAGETGVLTDRKENEALWLMMGDAGTATAIEFKQEGEKIFFNLKSDGSGFNAIIAPKSGSRFRSLNTELDPIFFSNSTEMNGDSVAGFCLTEVIPTVNSLLDFAKVSKETINYFVFHQANMVINESLRKKLSIPPSKFPYSIGEFGNTSSASIPLTIVKGLVSEQISSTSKFCCFGFGIGFSWAGVIFDTQAMKFCPIVYL